MRIQVSKTSLLMSLGGGLSCHVQTNVLFEALAYMVYIREKYHFSLVCTSRKAIISFEVKIDVQKGGPSCLEKFLTVDILVSSNSCFHPLLSYDHSP